MEAPLVGLLNCLSQLNRLPWMGLMVFLNRLFQRRPWWVQMLRTSFNCQQKEVNTHSSSPKGLAMVCLSCRCFKLTIHANSWPKDITSAAIQAGGRVGWCTSRGNARQRCHWNTGSSGSGGSSLPHNGLYHDKGSWSDIHGGHGPWPYGGPIGHAGHLHRLNPIQYQPAEVVGRIHRV